MTREIEVRERKSNFIHEFKATPEGIICPRFYILSHALGCPYSCDYCYLMGTLRRQEKNIQYSNLDKMGKDVARWLHKTKGPAMLNMGELADSMAWHTHSRKVLDKILPLFKQQQTGIRPEDKYLLLLTKSGNWYPSNTKFLIQSWSMNAPRVAEMYEKGCQDINGRISAAFAAKDAGCRIRIRIDPIIPIKCYKAAYQRLIDSINTLRPERVTLGSLRFFKTLPTFAPDTNVWYYGVDNGDPDNRMRLPFDLRVGIYKWFINQLECKEVGLCKETKECHRQVFGEIASELECNCTP
jgi:DNA repair photolyase